MGVFPVYPFDANAIYTNMLNVRQSLSTMQGSHGAVHNADANACSAYVDACDVIFHSGTFYEDIPTDWEEIDFAYGISFIYSVDRIRPAYLSCRDAG